MTKDFNKDLDQTDGDKSRKVGRAEGKPREEAPDDDSQVAHERTGAGFKGPADELAESGQRGAGYREADPKQEKKKSGA